MISGVVFIILLRLSRRRFLHPPARLQAVSLLLENPLRGTVIETACSVALSASVASLRNSFNSLDTHQGSFANFEVETTLNDTMNSFIWMLKHPLGFYPQNGSHALVSPSDEKERWKVRSDFRSEGFKSKTEFGPPTTNLHVDIKYFVI